MTTAATTTVRSTTDEMHAAKPTSPARITSAVTPSVRLLRRNRHRLKGLQKDRAGSGWSGMRSAAYSSPTTGSTCAGGGSSTYSSATRRQCGCTGSPWLLTLFNSDACAVEHGTAGQISGTNYAGHAAISGTWGHIIVAFLCALCQLRALLPLAWNSSICQTPHKIDPNLLFQVRKIYGTRFRAGLPIASGI